MAVMTNYMAETINKIPPEIFVEISKKSCGTIDFYYAEELVEIGFFHTFISYTSSETVRRHINTERQTFQAFTICKAS